MGVMETAADIAGDVCGIISGEFGDWCERMTKKAGRMNAYPSIEFTKDGRIKNVKLNIVARPEDVDDAIDAVIDSAKVVYTWFDENVRPVKGQKITREMVEGVYRDKGINIGTGKLVIRRGTPSTEPEAMFRAVNDFSGGTGHFGGFPNFHQADHGRGVVYGTILLNKNFVEWRDVPASTLGNPPDFGARFRAVNDYARSQEFHAGFPNFHQADHGNGIVYGVMLLKPGAGKWRDIPADELGNPGDIGSRFRAVNDYAISRGYRAAIPNFHQADHGRGIVYGTYLLNDSAADWKDVPAVILFPPGIDVDIVERKPSQPPPRSWEHREKPWDIPHRRNH